MDLPTQLKVSCPYCGESIEVLIDSEEVGQQYIEDCQVCCHPILIRVSVGIQDIDIQTAKESDGF